MSSVLQNHSLCTRPAAKHAICSLIVDMEFTIEKAAYEDIASPKSFVHRRRRVDLSVNAGNSNNAYTVAVKDQRDLVSHHQLYKTPYIHSKVGAGFPVTTLWLPMTSPLMVLLYTAPLPYSYALFILLGTTISSHINHLSQGFNVHRLQNYVTLHINLL